MQLIMHEVVTTVAQKITIGANNLNIYAIRPHIYKALSPGGNVYLEIRDENFKLVAASDAVAVSAISLSNYFHGYVKFLCEASLTANTDYYVYMKTNGGYTFSNTNFIAWCNAFDLSKVDADYTPVTGLNAPLDLELWGYKDTIKGFYV